MKRVFCIIIGLLAVATAYGQSFLESVYLTPDRGWDGVYAKGDTIRVYADADREMPALVKVYRNGKFQGVDEVLLKAEEPRFSAALMTKRRR